MRQQNLRLLVARAHLLCEHTDGLADGPPCCAPSSESSSVCDATSTVAHASAIAYAATASAPFVIASRQAAQLYFCNRREQRRGATATAAAVGDSSGRTARALVARGTLARMELADGSATWWTEPTISLSDTWIT